ncbi:glycosyltransferase [Pseudofrankia asymbiotica]|uniref:Glycosyltransferase subfamily 4-like N-terminal domain-containing protein n=1 Tax=Pseudofrankia asymbiotica TaxID=1834516 RepID=A0A1V2I0R2_9ACTN|nr:glycosyltransferase [Pseudofrankia asymbiotica]ONH21732.1 hypothetical protein BL253_38170 [Pseudofrankia asymbiotica]
MKIVHSTDCYLPRLGGIELHVQDLAHRQRVLGHRVMVATRSALRIDAAGPGEADILRRRSVDIDQLARLDPDVVHVHLSVVSPFAPQTANRAAMLGVPKVVTVHSLWNDIARVALVMRSLTGAHR